MSAVARRRQVLGLALACAFGGARAAPALQSIEQLFSALAAVGERRASFVERRHSPLLRQPIETRGTLLYRPPGVLERNTTVPRAEFVRIDGDAVLIRSAAADGQPVERRVPLALAPQLGWLTQMLRALLGGQLDALRRLYFIDWQSDAQHWRIELTPRDAQWAALVTRIAVSGEGHAVERIEIIEANGDRVEMTLSALR